MRDPPGNQRHLDPALEPGAIEGRVAAARMERGRIERIRLVGIEADDVGRGADVKALLRGHRRDPEFGRDIESVRELLEIETRT